MNRDLDIDAHQTTNKIKVWDPIVRIGHWTLAIAFFTAYFTEDEFMTQHTWAGYVVGAIILFRILWGFIGTKHAKFNDFIYSPKAIFTYLKGLVSCKPQHYVGHNPAGGAMAIALILSLLGTVYTGLTLYAVEENAGPFAGIMAISKDNAPAITVISSAYASASENNHKIASSAISNKDAEEFWEELHEFFANLTLLLVALHIGGVLLSSYIDKENLIKTMITGRKEMTKDVKRHS